MYDTNCVGVEIIKNITCCFIKKNDDDEIVSVKVAQFKTISKSVSP